MEERVFKPEEKTISISLNEYKKLIENETKVKTAIRFCKAESYVDSKSLLMVLDAEEAAENENA